MDTVSLYNDWQPAEATIDIDGVMVNLRCPSKVALGGALGHLIPDNHLFIRQFCKSPVNYIVDVGANMGAVSILFARAFPQALILAIEPVQVNYECLVHNTKDFPYITPIKAAVWSEKTKLRIAMPTLEQRPDLMRRYGNAGLFSAYGEDPKHYELVQADTLDNIIDDKIDLLKLDVEGSELHVLEGAQRTMTKDKPTVIIELRESNVAMSGHTMQDYTDYFEAMDYRKVGTYLGDIVLRPRKYGKLPTFTPRRENG